jgi:NAD(P)-dependent dehydrogenase (short-subunit alcohol dehydrogenase family)
MFTRALRLYKRKGIRVNVLCPEVRVVFELWKMNIFLVIKINL